MYIYTVQFELDGSWISSRRQFNAMLYSLQRENARDLMLKRGGGGWEKMPGSFGGFENMRKVLVC